MIGTNKKDAADTAAKIIERRCTMLGLYTPPAAVLQVVEAQAPKETSTDRIRAAIDRIRAENGKPPAPGPAIPAIPTPTM